jgi:hypothetical protein
MPAYLWSRPGAEPRAARVLHLLLGAALLPPLLPGAFGASLPAPFGAPRAGLLAALLVMVATRPREPRSHLVRMRAVWPVDATLWLLAAAIVAVALAAIVARRATPFYSGAVLSDVMLVLLGVHLCGLLVRRGIARSAADDRSGRVADTVAALAAWLVAAFWAIAAAGAREVAGLALLAAGMALVASVFMRLVEAWIRLRVGDRVRARRHGRPRRSMRYS